MVLRTLAVLALMNGPPSEPPATPPMDVRAECLKGCAGAPKTATGQKLLACIEQCAARDAGTR